MKKTLHILGRILQSKTTEFVIFTLFVLLNATFLTKFTYIHSLDGAQHIYNSMVIAELAKGNELMGVYFSLNPVIVGYWIGPFLLSLFNYLFAANVAMKLLIFVCLAGVAYSFRYLVYSIKKETNYLPLLIIPLAMHAYLLMGYYTFSLAWAFFFLVLGYYIRKRNELRGWALLWMGLLFLLLYLSHLVVFAFALICLVVYILYQFIELVVKRNKAEIRTQIFNVLKLIGVSLPALVLTLIYAMHVFIMNGKMANTDLPTERLFENLVVMRNLIGFDNVYENPLGTIVFFSFVAAMVYLLILFILKRRKGSKILANQNTKGHYIWLLMSLLILVLYFFMPNTFGTGAMSVRILVWFYFVFVLWISLQKMHWPVVLILLSAMFFTTIERNKIMNGNLEYLNSDVKEITSVGKLMEPNRVYYLLNYSDYWNHLHMGCYAGADIPSMYVLNPQCGGHFPVIWNKKELPYVLLGDKSRHDLKRKWFSADSLHQIQVIDYVVVWGYGSFLYDTSATRRQVDKYYSLLGVSEKGNAAIFKFKFRKNLEEGFQKMRTTPEWWAHLNEKATQQGLPVENIMYHDAFYLLESYVY